MADGKQSKPTENSAPEVDENEEVDGGTGDAEVQTVSLFLAVGMVVGALIIGLVVGYVVAPSGDSLPAGSTPAMTAPTLTPEQLNNQQLPAEHPQLPQGVGDPGPATGSPEPGADQAAPPQ